MTHNLFELAQIRVLLADQWLDITLSAAIQPNQKLFKFFLLLLRNWVNQFKILIGYVEEGSFCTVLCVSPTWNAISVRAMP